MPVPCLLRRTARHARLFAATVLPLLAAGCAHRQQVAYAPPPPDVYGSGGRPVESRNEVPRRQAPPPPATLPAEIRGAPDFTEVGMASWYGPNYHHQHAADGSVYDQDGLTAAHRELPLGSIVRVTNVATGESVVVHITDRGPFVPGRVLDLSLGAAKAISVWRAGVARVRIEAWTPRTADVAGRWCVQVGAFKTVAQALDLKADLMDQYPQARVMEFTGPTGFWVRIDPAEHTHTAANEVAKAMSIEDPAALPYVTRLN